MAKKLLKEDSIPWIKREVANMIVNKEDKFTPGKGLEMTEDRTLNVTLGSSEWFGTQSEYDDLGTYDDNTKYYIYEE